MTADPESSFGQGPRQGNLPLILGLGVGLAGILAVWVLSSGALLIRPAPEPTPATTEESPTPPPADLSECRRLALAAWRGFIEAPDFQERLEFIKDPERVAPLMRDFHEARGHGWPTMAKISHGEIPTQGARRHVLFVVEPYEGRPYAAPLEWTDGAYRVDWEVLTAYGTMDWPELIESRPRETQRMRVFLSPMNERWEDPKLPPDAASFVIEHRSSPEPAVGVARGAVATRLAAAVTAPRTPLRIDVVWSESLEALEIVHLAGLNWTE